MIITTKIEKNVSDAQDHHYECSKDHTVETITFTSQSEDGGRSSCSIRNCLLFEIEDVAQDVLVGAYEDSVSSELFSMDEGSLRDAVVELAAAGDYAEPGTWDRLYHDVS